MLAQNQRGGRRRILHRLRLGAFPGKGKRKEQRKVSQNIHLEREEPACLYERRAVHGELRIRPGRTAGDQVHGTKRDALLQQDVDPAHGRRKLASRWGICKERLSRRDKNRNKTCLSQRNQGLGRSQQNLFLPLRPPWKRFPHNRRKRERVPEA